MNYENNRAFADEGGYFPFPANISVVILTAM
jgi:hypothetical protein